MTAVVAASSAVPTQRLDYHKATFLDSVIFLALSNPHSHSFPVIITPKCADKTLDQSRGCLLTLLWPASLPTLFPRLQDLALYRMGTEPMFYYH